MDNAWLDKWNARYREPAYAYGVSPNQYLVEQLAQLSPGAILFPAEGEGRNAVFAAQEGWRVSAFDISIEGQKKALRLAATAGVAINYRVGELASMAYAAGQFDVIALIYAHFPAAVKSVYHRLLQQLLREDGVVIFEAFSKNHLAYNEKDAHVGGPKEAAALFSMDELKADFANFKVIELVETEVELTEGFYHQGKGCVIRFVGQKM